MHEIIRKNEKDISCEINNRFAYYLILWKIKLTIQFKNILFRINETLKKYKKYASAKRIKITTYINKTENKI